MAGLGNLNMSDMKWIGEPLDVVGQYQKGVNLAEQGQRMQQSADMHPLKMEDTKARTNLVKQAGEYNLRTMDSRVGLSGSMARLQQTAASIAENTQYEEQDRLKAISQQQVTNAWIGKATSNLHVAALNASSEGAVLNQAKTLANQEYAIEAERAGMELEVNKATLYEQTMGNQRSLMEQRVALGQQQANLATHENGRWEEEKEIARAEWARIAAMTNVERMNYTPNPNITSTIHQRELAQFATGQKSGEQWADFRKAEDILNSADAERGIKYTKAKGEMNAQTFGILELTDKLTGNPLFEKSADNKQLNQPGWVMLDKLIASDAVWKRLSPENKKTLREAMEKHPRLPGLHVPPGSTSTGQYGSDYSGQMVLDEAGLAEANGMLVGQDRAGELSRSKWLAQVLNLRPDQMDANGNITRKYNLPSRLEVAELVTKQITSITERVVSQKELEDETKLLPADLTKIRQEALKNVHTALIQVGVNSADIGITVGAGGTYTADGKVLKRPRAVVTPTGGTPGTPGAARPASAGDSLLGANGWSTPEAKAAAEAKNPDVKYSQAVYDMIEPELKFVSQFHSRTDTNIQKANDARFITKLVVTGKLPSIGADSTANQVMEATRVWAKKQSLQSSNDLKAAMWAGGRPRGQKYISQDNIARITAAVKEHGNNPAKWPKLVQKYSLPSAKGKGFSGGDYEHTIDYSPKSAAKIVDAVNRFNNWNTFIKRTAPYK